MLVLIKSAPESSESKRAVKLARDMAADICLMQDSVYLAMPERIEGFCGTVYVIEEDARMRGLQENDIDSSIKQIGYEELVDLMLTEDKVIGLF